ncbi:SCO4402 family protein [Planotetraspora kaengkrachanensis]|uniref:SCO4402 family protein n=1 Tax=Planotetraspora kaengkrachanensis TaxID=575193 RepID=UPI003CD0B998
MSAEPSATQRVQWPERREDVLNALQVLGDRDYQEQHWRSGHGWPDLTNAVHWLIDDTFIDQTGARALIPQLFRDEREADLVQIVVDALLRVLDDLGPTAPDDAYLDHPAWISVLHSAHTALQVLSPDQENRDDTPQRAADQRETSPNQAPCP